jgi:hypothetical protein
MKLTIECPNAYAYVDYKMGYELIQKLKQQKRVEVTHIHKPYGRHFSTLREITFEFDKDIANEPLAMILSESLF